MRLSRRIVEGEGSEAYDMIEDTQHPPSSDQLPRQFVRMNISTKQIRQGNPAGTDTTAVTRVINLPTFRNLISHHSNTRR